MRSSRKRRKKSYKQYLSDCLNNTGGKSREFIGKNNNEIYNKCLDFDDFLIDLIERFSNAEK